MSQSLTKVNKVERALANARNRLREGARLGSNSLIGGLGGGIVSGFLEAKVPVIPGTSINTGAVVGSTLVAIGLIGWASDYSDEACALGAGLVAASVSREAERYFASP
jgi:hypothetical protein